MPAVSLQPVPPAYGCVAMPAASRAPEALASFPPNNAKDCHD